jgi:hypothetical protein
MLSSDACSLIGMAAVALLEIAVVALLERTIVTRMTRLAVLTRLTLLHLLGAGCLVFALRTGKAALMRLGLAGNEGAFILALITLTIGLIKATEAGILNPVLFLRRSHETEIMLSMLEKAFRLHVIARGLRIAAQLEIFFGNALRGATDLHLRAVRFVGAREGIRAFAATIAAATIPATHTLVLMIRSHRTSFLLEKIGKFEKMV